MCVYSHRKTGKKKNTYWWTKDACTKTKAINTHFYMHRTSDVTVHKIITVVTSGKETWKATDLGWTRRAGSRL